MILFRKLNPTSMLLRATTFLKHHVYVFTLLCLLNVNMAALDLSRPTLAEEEEAEAMMSQETNLEDEDSLLIRKYRHENDNAVQLLHDLQRVYAQMSKEHQQGILQRVVSSGALPIARDTPSYAALMSMLAGGVASQFSTPMRQKPNTSIKSPSASSPRKLRLTFVADDKETEVDEEEDVASSRAEAKRESIERLSQYTQSPAKSSSSTSASPYRLLGELPSLLTATGQSRMAEIQHLMRLELPLDHSKQKSLASKLITPKASSSNNRDGFADASSSSIPKDFLCAINGHVMKMPMKGPYQIHYERETIELWLATRGSICPITHQPLTRADLQLDEELQNRIKRYQIQQTAMRTARAGDDDLYDF
jgi:hypothetical protein